MLAQGKDFYLQQIELSLTIQVSHRKTEFWRNFKTWEIILDWITLWMNNSIKQLRVNKWDNI